MNKKVLLPVLAAMGALPVMLFVAQSDEASTSADNPVAASGKIERRVPSVDLDVKSAAAPVPENKTAGRYETVSDNAQFPTLDQRIAELGELYPYREFSADEVLDLLAQTNAWESSATVPDSLPLTDEQKNDGRAFIELNPERFQVLLPGDTLELPLEKLGMHLQMQVDSREPLANGGFTLHGHLVGSNEIMRVTITQGPGLSLAGIDTPQGHVVMQANDTHGWIASSETLFKQDPHTTDVLLPTDE